MSSLKKSVLCASFIITLVAQSALADNAPFSSYSECASQNPNEVKVCEQVFISSTRSSGTDTNSDDDGDIKSGSSGIREDYDTRKQAERAVHEWGKTTNANGFTLYYSKTNPNVQYCVTKDGRVGTYKIVNLYSEDGYGTVDRGRPAMGMHNPSSETCFPSDIKAVQDTKSEANKGPTWEQMMAQIIEAAQSLEPGKPTLHQSYNNPAGTGRAEGDPNIYKGDQVNFYVDDGGPYRLEADMLAGHVEIELMPSSYVIEYGNGDTDTNYTAGKPVTTYPRERPRQTETSYAYQRSGNFHAYATVHYTARFRVDGGPWQMMMVTPQATSDPLLIRVWWTDVGRVAGDCSYDDTRWGCKNDPTMGKKDNPNPRLRKADIRTGQRWHLNDNGDGDTEYSLHRDWPDM